jgi:hypothetical protein
VKGKGYWEKVGYAHEAETQARDPNERTAREWAQFHAAEASYYARNPNWTCPLGQHTRWEIIRFHQDMAAHYEAVAETLKR